MRKKTNSLIFMAVATLVNLVLLFVTLVAGIVILSLLPISDSPNAYAIGIFVVFLLGIVISFTIYSKLVKWATVKFNLEDKLDPLLTPKRNRRDKRD